MKPLYSFGTENFFFHLEKIDDDTFFVRQFNISRDHGNKEYCCSIFDKKELQELANSITQELKTQELKTAGEIK